MDETNRIDTKSLRDELNECEYGDSINPRLILRLCDALDEARADALLFAEKTTDLIARKNNLHERLNEEIARVTRAEAKLARVEAWVNRIETYYGDVPQRFSIAADVRAVLKDRP